MSLHEHSGILMAIDYILARVNHIELSTCQSFLNRILLVD